MDIFLGEGCAICGRASHLRSTSRKMALFDLVLHSVSPVATTLFLIIVHIHTPSLILILLDSGTPSRRSCSDARSCSPHNGAPWVVYLCMRLIYSL